MLVLYVQQCCYFFVGQVANKIQKKSLHAKSD